MKDEKPTDYRVFFVLGICLLGLGVSLMSAIGSAFISFLGCGVVFIIISLANRDKWEKFKKET